MGIVVYHCPHCYAPLPRFAGEAGYRWAAVGVGCKWAAAEGSLDIRVAGCRRAAVEGSLGCSPAGTPGCSRAGSLGWAGSCRAAFVSIIILL